MIDAADMQAAEGLADAGFEEDRWPKGGDDALEAPEPLPDEPTVPLELLDEGGDDNVRTSASKVEIEALMASIMHTHRRPLQPVVVAKIGGRYKVGAGNRRLRALKLAQKRGLIPKNHPVPVKFAREDELHEISLTENIMRVQLHPVDEFEAFSQLRDEGLTTAAIADRFGLKELAVRQRLALGSLAAEVRKAWRDGRIGQEQAQAFTICDDHEAQRQALKAGTASKGHYNSYAVNQILQAGRDNIKSGRFTFVGRDAYLAAGGALREDLFGDVVLIEHPEILSRLFADKIAAVKRELVTVQGWAFAVHRNEVEQSFAWATLPLDPWMTPDERAILSKGSPHAPVQWQTRRELIKRVAEIPEARAASGVVFDVNYHGQIEIDALKLRPADADDDDGLDQSGEDADEESGDELEDDSGVDVSAPAPADATDVLVQSKPLLEDLSEQLGDAITECLVAEPELALLAVTAALHSSRWGSPVRMQRDGSPARRSHSDAAFADELGRLGALPYEAVLGELARAVAGALETRSSIVDVDSKLQGGIVALVGRISPEAFRSALARSFQVRSFFDRAPGAVAKAAAEEAGAGAIKGKKSELAERATEIAQKTGWLPPSLRTVHYLPPVPPAGDAS
jgi:ParB/RepB/Spo0J family partition protein